ncbi:hypothetical protein ACRRTK_020067 [Alexandromys fortis]
MLTGPIRTAGRCRNGPFRTKGRSRLTPYGLRDYVAIPRRDDAAGPPRDYADRVRYGPRDDSAGPPQVDADRSRPDSWTMRKSLVRTAGRCRRVLSGPRDDADGSRPDSWTMRKSLVRTAGRCRRVLSGPRDDADAPLPDRGTIRRIHRKTMLTGSRPDSWTMHKSLVRTAGRSRRVRSGPRDDAAVPMRDDAAGPPRDYADRVLSGPRTIRRVHRKTMLTGSRPDSWTRRKSTVRTAGRCVRVRSGQLDDADAPRPDRGTMQLFH